MKKTAPSTIAGGGPNTFDSMDQSLSRESRRCERTMSGYDVAPRDRGAAIARLCPRAWRSRREWSSLRRPLSDRYMRFVRRVLREVPADYRRGLAECRRLGRWGDYWVLRKLIVEFELVERPQWEHMLREHAELLAGSRVRRLAA